MPLALANRRQLGGAFPHLGNRTGSRLQRVRINRLYRIDHGYARLPLGEHCLDLFQPDLRQQVYSLRVQRHAPCP